MVRFSLREDSLNFCIFKLFEKIFKYIYLYCKFLFKMIFSVWFICIYIDIKRINIGVNRRDLFDFDLNGGNICLLR